MANINKAKDLQVTKDLIKRFEELWDDAAIKHDYTNSPELKNIAKKLESSKLSDDFLLEDLTAEELKILNEKVYVLAHT